jgi:hypothetical protein
MTPNHAENRRILTGIGLILGAAGLMLVFAAVVSSTPKARATHVDPVLVEGNPTCATLSPGTNELKIDPPSDGTFNDSDGPLSVTIDVRSTSDGQVFDFTSNIPVKVAFAKGGNIGGNKYTYNPAETSDTGLHAPENPSGDWANLSHITFCYDPSAPTPTNTPVNTPTNTNTPTNGATNTPTNTPPTNTPTNTPVATSTQPINFIPTSVPTSTTVNQVLASTSVPTVAPTRAAEVLPTRLAATGNGPGSSGHNTLMLGIGFAALISGAGLLLLVRRRATEQ